MRSLEKTLILAAAILGQLCAPAGAQEPALAQAPQSRGASEAPAPGKENVTLADLEQIALRNNPTLVQAQANIRSARGRARQAGAMPNPVVGYEGAELAFKFFDVKSEHFGFIEQTVPLGGKLSKARRIYLKEAQRAEIESDAQRQRVINSVRSLYFEVLGTQLQIDLQTELSRIAHDTVNTTVELLNVGQADKPDQLQAEIEAEQVDHALKESESHLALTWKILAATIGTPDMALAHLEGKLDDRIPSVDGPALLNNLVQSSPQIKAAQARVDQAKATLVRAKAEPIPDLFLRGSMGDSLEFIDTDRSGTSLRRTGPEANLQVGMSLPVWNRNQGAIASAHADLDYSQAELERLKLQLRAQFANEIQNYNVALDEVKRYRDQVIPRADQAYQLYLTRFKQMGASYPQVIIAQRTMFRARKQYIEALVQLQRSSTQLEGFMLSGGLTAPQLGAVTETGPNNFVAHTETAGVRSGTDNPLDTAGLVEY
jgi:cobalt-zinc-cadmium efflux system outer membrane protein